MSITRCKLAPSWRKNIHGDQYLHFKAVPSQITSVQGSIVFTGGIYTCQRKRLMLLAYSHTSSNEHCCVHAHSDSKKKGPSESYLEQGGPSGKLCIQVVPSYKCERARQKTTNTNAAILDQHVLQPCAMHSFRFPFILLVHLSTASALLLFDCASHARQA